MSGITGVHHAGCSKRQSSKAAASEEARRTLRYVEPLSAARTPLADFFSILLEHAGAGAEEISLIVMDVRMPEIDGIEACRRIKAVEALYDIPIIIMTARSQQEALRAAFDAGATDFIKKPFEEVELLARVEATLKLKKETDARKKWEWELTETIRQLDAAFNELVTLQQLIPVCPVCKKSPAGQTSQSALETYIQTHPNAKFHYRVCFSCSIRKG